VVDYAQLPAQAWERIAPHFGLQPDDAARARMGTVATGHAKAPLGQDVAFTPDGARKRAQATPALVQAIGELARPAWAALAKRQGPG
jgi:beta-phosphoglucomutase-like phosphatase (HAD superfamily)